MERSKHNTYGFDKCASEADVQARWRELAKLLHPDHGGDNTLLVEARQARDYRLHEISNAQRETNNLPNVILSVLGSEAVQKILADEVSRRLSPEVKNALMTILKHAK